MKIRFPILIAGAVMAFISFPAYSQTSHLYNPAEDKANGSVARNEEDQAWFGEYASNDQPYNPLFLEDLSGVQGDPVIVWARVRGCAIQTKAVDTYGTQTELSWAWDNPKDWKWVKLGSYSRAQIGAKLLIIRGPDATPNAGLNAVLLTSDANLNPAALTQKELEAKIKAAPPAPAGSPAN